MRLRAILWLLCCASISAHPFNKITILANYLIPRTGPFGVYHSLVDGFSKLAVPFNCNPPHNQVGDVVIVLSGIDNLRKAVAWKKQGRIRCLLGGPNIMNRPNESNFIFADPAVDGCLVPSEWIKVAYEEDAPGLKGRIFCWFAGINYQQWKPTSKIKNKVLVYWKTDSESLCHQVESLLRKYNYTPVRVRYKQYNPDHYKQLLDQSQFAVFVSRSESQGIALAEAWAMNVPTLIWDPGVLTYLGRKYSIVSAAPYLTEYTGKSWDTFAELEELIDHFGFYNKQFSPRLWLQKCMTNEASARCMLDIIEKVYG